MADIVEGEVVAAEDVKGSKRRGRPPKVVEGEVLAPGEVEVSKTSKKEDALAAVFKNDVVKAMLKKFGPTMIMRAVESDARVQHRIPTGIFQLDFALSGGFLVGAAHEVHGPQSACKTTLMLKMVAQAQQRCANCWNRIDSKGHCGTKGCAPREAICAYIDVEGTLDLGWAKKLGVDLDRLLHLTPPYAEASLDLLDGLLRSGTCDVIVLDSIAFLSPLKEVESSMDQETMGLQARIMGKGVRKFVAGMR